MSFVGFFEIGSTYNAAILVRDNGLSPLDADSAPVFRVYGPNGILAGVTGACTLLDSGDLATASSDTPVVYASSDAHNLSSGFVVTVSGVTRQHGGKRHEPYHSDVCNRIHDGRYCWYREWDWRHLASHGMYTYTFDVSSVNGFASGTLYIVVIEGTAGGILFSYSQTFQCN